MESIKINRTQQSKINTIDFKNLGFGSEFSDHMLVCDYKNGDEWQQGGKLVLNLGNISSTD